MKHRVFWSRDAIDTLKEAVQYIARDDPQAARRVAAAIRAAGNAMGERAMGRRGRVTGTYEKLIAGTPYIIAYALAPTPEGDEAVFILNVIHTARDWRNESWPAK